MEEVWKDIEGYEGLYQVSNLGRVKSLSREVVGSYGRKHVLKEKIRKLISDKEGYLTVTLHKGGMRKTFKVHRLVASSFIVNSASRQFVNHLNGIKEDNKVKNLEWATSSENQKHAYDTGLKHAPFGEKHKKAKLTSREVKLIKQQLNEHSGRALARKFGVGEVTISCIKTGKTWKNI